MPGSKIEGQLEVLEKTSRAGEPYAAELLRRLDKEAGEKAFKAILSDKPLFSSIRVAVQRVSS